MGGKLDRDSSHVTNVGDRIRMLREQRNLSQRELARVSALSPNTLSLIERGKTSPTASTLQKLAGTLNVSVSAFFEPDEAVDADDIIFTQSRRRARFTASHGFAEDLGPVGENSLVTPIAITVKPGANSGPPMTHSGQEFAYCLSGQVLYAINDRVFLLEPGDSLLFDAEHPHRWQNAGGQPAEVLMILCLSDEGIDFVIQELNGEE
jgi:transcriptional regulator with XRE-family HTH domain